MKMTFISVVAAIVAAGLLASSSRSDAQEMGPYTTRQPADSGVGQKLVLFLISAQIATTFRLFKL
jgi:hypothetical protein